MSGVGAIDISTVVNRTASVPVAPGARSGDTGAALGTSFASTLQALQHQRDESMLREAAEKLVTDAFVKPALSAMRESPFLTGPFAPGPGEKRFMPMLDELMADRITQAANFPLVDAVMEHISNLAGYRPAPTDAAGSNEVRYG